MPMGTSGTTFGTKLKNWYSLANLAHIATIFLVGLAVLGTWVAVDFFIVTRESDVRWNDPTQLTVYPEDLTMTALENHKLPSDCIFWVAKGTERYALSPLQIKPEYRVLALTGEIYEALREPDIWANLESELGKNCVWLITIQIWNEGEGDSGLIKIKTDFDIEEESIVDMKNLDREDKNTFSAASLSPNKKIELTLERNSDEDITKIEITADNTKSRFTETSKIWLWIVGIALFALLCALPDIIRQDKKLARESDKEEKHEI